MSLAYLSISNSKALERTELCIDLEAFFQLHLWVQFILVAAFLLQVMEKACKIQVPGIQGKLYLGDVFTGK
jgi:hypothetical protein